MAATSPSAPLHPHEEELLAKLEAANKLLEADEKSLQSLATSNASNSGGSSQGTAVSSGHSRKGSGSSSSSIGSHLSSNLPCDGDVVAETESHWESWGRVVNDWSSAKKKMSHVRELVRKNVPHHFRSLIWQLLCNVPESSAKELYIEYLRKPSPSEKQIKRDIARTFPEHDFFRDKDGLGQESLFNVMKAYSLHDREVGYCQGSGFIVGLLLMQMPEEEAFAVLVYLMQEYRLRELFKPSMAELGLCMYQLECLIQDLLPELFQHFQSQAFHTTMYASTWFLTLFTTTLPLAAACRIMDLFISEGMEMIFRVGMAILQRNCEVLMSLDMEGMLRFFQKQVPAMYEQDSDTDILFATAFSIRYNAKKMKKLEKEYTALKSRENEDQIELRRLRTENRLLRQRIDNLEKESAALADRLIHDQVTRAQEAEETFVLRNKLSNAHTQLIDASGKVKQAEVLMQAYKMNNANETAAVESYRAEAQRTIREQQELLHSAKQMELESSSQIADMQNLIAKLEDANKQLQRAPSNDVQQLQEELIAVKLREAECNLALKELRQRVYDLNTHWEKHLMRCQSCGASQEKSDKIDSRSLRDEMMTVKLRDAMSLAELKDVKQRLMEMETQNQINTNQIRRQGEDVTDLRSQLDTASSLERELRNTIKTLERKISDLQTQKQEELMMSRIKEAEEAQLIEELRQKIAALEIQKEELLTAGKLQQKSGNPDLEGQIDDLQDEVMTLRLQGGLPLESTRTSDLMTISMYEDDIIDDIASAGTLNRTLALIVNGRDSLEISSISRPLEISDNSRHDDLGEAVYNNNNNIKSESNARLQNVMNRSCDDSNIDLVHNDINNLNLQSKIIHNSDDIISDQLGVVLDGTSHRNSANSGINLHSDCGVDLIANKQSDHSTRVTKPDLLDHETDIGETNTGGLAANTPTATPVIVSGSL